MNKAVSSAVSFRLIAIVVIAAGLSACKEMATKPVAHICGCVEYTSSKARPAWVDREISTVDEYQSQGIAECTNIKSMDYADAEKRARENLGMMVNVQVKSEVISVMKDSGLGSGASNFGQVASEQVSNVLLKNSEIFDHWVDSGSCTVYAGARVRKADIDRAIKEAETAEKQKAVNQRWALTAEGQHADIISAQLGQTLSTLGVTLQNDRADSGFVMSGKVNDVSMHNDNKMARVSIKLEARNGNSIIWNRLAQGKGVSFNRETEAVLVKKAVQDALENAREELQKFMQEPVK